VRIVGLVSDLMFSTRLTDTARALGHECAVIRDPDGLSDRIAAADLVVIDLDITTGDAVAAVHAATAAGRPVVAYGGHVEVERLQAARDAGADAVLSRGEFTNRLPELLGAEPT
jgi:hypothetical protein